MLLIGAAIPRVFPVMIIIYSFNGFCVKYVHELYLMMVSLSNNGNIYWCWFYVMAYGSYEIMPTSFADFTIRWQQYTIVKAFIAQAVSLWLPAVTARIRYRFMRNLWWTECHGGRGVTSTFVSYARPHSSLTYHPGLIQ